MYLLIFALNKLQLKLWWLFFFLQIGILAEVRVFLQIYFLGFCPPLITWKLFPFFFLFSPPSSSSSLLYRSKDYSALPAKRLWHFLVKQELLQETFIRYIFTKKRKQSEVNKGCNFFLKESSVITVPQSLQYFF